MRVDLSQSSLLPSHLPSHLISSNISYYHLIIKIGHVQMTFGQWMQNAMENHNLTVSERRHLYFRLLFIISIIFLINIIFHHL